MCVTTTPFPTGNIHSPCVSFSSRIFFRARPKILALCGSRSNNAVTQLQLENLHVTSERYDIHYLHGNIIVEDDDDVDAALAGMVRGPFYSWINNTSGFEAMNESIVNSVRLVIGATRVYGPFDGVYGFSHGTCESLEMILHGRYAIRFLFFVVCIPL